MKKEEIEKRLEEIFGRGSRQEIEKAATNEKIVERIEELSKREEQFEEWERMRRESKRKQREDRRLNLFWRRNKSFPKQFGGEDVTPDANETLLFWRAINNKEVGEGLKEDRSIREAFTEVKWKTGEASVDSSSSRKKNLKKSSVARHLGRRAELTQFTRSRSRSAQSSRRQCSSW